MDIFMEIRQEIEQLAENDYKKFSASLLPGVDKVLGVRLPQLRKLAGRIAAGDWQRYLAAEPDYFEEVMLQGMVIGAIKVTPEERLQYMADFIPKINSWSVCDSFCSGLKFTNKNQELVWDFLMMDYYLTAAYIDLVLPLLDGVVHDGYYVKMAVAWALATALAKQPEKTWDYFQHHHLDADTWKKTIQKCLESRRIPEEQKAALRQMRKAP